MDLQDLRNQIDVIDDQISGLFEQRLAIVEEVAKIKLEQNLPVLNASREQEIISRLTKNQPNALAGYTKTLFSVIFDLSRSHQSDVIDVCRV